tara:strand:- start:787 stop:1269 length:483 start_codon:yes stop_codon:yes gene_type:complete
MIKHININNEFISKVEQLRGKDLKLEHIHILSIVNSFARQGMVCSISRSTFSKLCRCGIRTIHNRFNDLVKWNMITLHIPKDQSKTHETNITHLHKDLKQILLDLASASDAPDLVHQIPKASAPFATNNKKMGDSSVSSLEEDPSSLTKKETFLETLIQL